MLFRLCKLRYPLIFHTIAVKFCILYVPFENYSILFYPITLEGRRGTKDEFATISFHLVLFSAALVELAKSIPVYSLILSFPLFFSVCLSFFVLSLCLFFFVLSLCPVGFSLLNQKTLKCGQTILVSVS